MRLHRCGVDIEVAFQYLDEFLDMYGEASIIGKEVSSDRRAALLTLPMLDVSQRLTTGMGISTPASESLDVQIWIMAVVWLVTVLHFSMFALQAYFGKDRDVQRRDSGSV